MIDRLSADLRRDFPDMTGLSARNLKYMRALAEAHPDRAFVQHVVARLSRGHVVRLLENVKDATRREWYARHAIEHGWSRNVLVHQIESNLYERKARRSRTFHLGCGLIAAQGITGSNHSLRDGPTFS